ncbi:hypothetical protein JF50_10425 [Pseudoalteromonas luteoviolacea]|uniref:Uncharacterized protein n=1 Tax=Pseudoalteromonas luteoviolacea TaxID=43657 RepID=A0A0C1QAE6_9GAMM|nr:hypothetical protein [Pseudoalteromonas luteoviolacea]KID57586.1 hypothetical protein JF50_10425 [Pseudoalteromonas luteoviolacea]
MDINKLKEYSYNNLGTIFWSSILLLGGSIFTIYYAHIRYMPSFDFQSSTMLLGASAITAFIILAIIVVAFILPGLYWRENFGKKIQQIKDVSTGVIIVLYLIPQVALFASVILIGKTYYLYTTCIFAVAMFIAAFIFKTKVAYQQLRKPKASFWKDIISYLFISFLSFCISISPIIILYGLASTAAKTDADAFLILAVSSVLSINLIAVISYGKRSKPFFYSALTITVLITVFIGFGEGNAVPKNVMARYGFGNFEVKTLTLKKEACNYLKAQNLHAINSSTDFCIYKDVIILSSLGENYFIEIGELEHIVAKDLVLSWSRERKTSIAQAENDELAK